MKEISEGLLAIFVLNMVTVVNGTNRPPTFYILMNIGPSIN